MTTYWIYPSLASLTAWRADATDDERANVSIRCSPSGETVIERIHRYKGYQPISRDVAERFVSSKDLDRLHTDSIQHLRRARHEGLIEGAKKELDRIGAK